MPNFICTTCGVQYAETLEPPAECRICADDRQYVNPRGQSWTTLAELQAAGHRNHFELLEAGLTGVSTEPRIAIGQRAILVQRPKGNILWDCISYIDQATVEAIGERGGLSAIAISHPHFYDSMIEWSHAFGGVPVYLHANDREWVQRPDPKIVFWEGETHSLGSDVILIRCGGHFPGSTVLFWSGGAEGKGVLLTADTIDVVADRRYVTFMYSFPNLIPLSQTAVEGVVQAVAPFSFERIYGGWSGSMVASGAKEAVRRSADRYIRMIKGGAGSA